MNYRYFPLSLTYLIKNITHRIFIVISIIIKIFKLFGFISLLFLFLILLIFFFFLTITHPTGIMLVSHQGHKTYSAETGMIPALSSLTGSGSQEVV